MWYGLWLLVVHDSPSTHPTITKEERNLLEEGSADIVKVAQEIVTNIVYLVQTEFGWWSWWWG